MDGLTRQSGSFHRFSQHPPLGVELAHSIRATLDAARPGSVAACTVNLNGDERRSQEFGNVMVRLTAEGIPTDFALWCPALNFGETGAATAALSICLGVRAIQRGYAPGESLLGAVLSDDGERGSFRLTRADTQAKKGSGG